MLKLFLPPVKKGKAFYFKTQSTRNVLLIDVVSYYLLYIRAMIQLKILKIHFAANPSG